MKNNSISAPDPQDLADLARLTREIAEAAERQQRLVAERDAVLLRVAAIWPASWIADRILGTTPQRARQLVQRARERLERSP